MAILEVQNIEKSFDRTPVLKDISFSLEQGQALAIIGSSGSGKTTLLRCLNFLEKPDKGRIVVQGETLFDAEDATSVKEKDIRMKRLHFGMVFQAFHLFPQYTALQNVMLARQLLEKGKPGFKENKKKIYEEIEAEAKELLDKMGLSDRMQHYPHQLSGGQQQRVAIARALATDPEIIYFDEPTSALDPELTGEVLGVMRQLAKEGMTMLVVTHEMGFARNVSNKVVFMENGVVVEEGPSKEFFANPREERTRTFLQNIEQHYE